MVRLWLPYGQLSARQSETMYSLIVTRSLPVEIWKMHPVSKDWDSAAEPVERLSGFGR